MGLLGFIKFALLCIHFFIWPIVALGYPLCASIRAIESGSKYHMRKLVIYWTLFSLVYLFELAFVKVIQWIPFWCCIKLVATVWLVFPRFNGAVQVYQSFVHPFLSVKLQAAITRYYKLKEEKPLTPEAFLNIAEKYMKENGFETLEQLIISKRECKKPDSSHSDIRVQGSDEQNAAAASKQLTVCDSLPKDKEVAEVTEPNLAEDRHAETPLQKKLQPAWTCSLCLVTTTCEITLNAHLQGNKHKSKIEALRISHHHEKGTGSLPSTNGILDQGNLGAARKGVMEGVKQKPCKKNEENVPYHLPSDREREAMMRNDGFATQACKLWCGVCKVKLLREIDMASHLKGKRHSSTVQKLRECKKPGSSHSSIQVQEPDEQNPEATAKQVRHAHFNTTDWVKKKTDASGDVKEMPPPEAKVESKNLEAPSPKKDQHQWMCALCHVTTTSQETLNCHIQGKEHKSKFDALKTSMHNEKSAGSLPSTKDIFNQGNCRSAKKGVGKGSLQKPSQKNNEKILLHFLNDSEQQAMLAQSGAATQPFTKRHGFCNVDLLTEIDMASHLNGKRLSSSLQKLRECKKPDGCRSDIQVQEPDMQKPAATPKLLNAPDSAQENGGMTHKTEQGASSESKLVQHTQPNNVAWDKMKTGGPAEVEEMILPDAKAVDRHPETPSQKTDESKWICALCKVTTTSEKTLNEHLQGNKHKSKIDGLITDNPNAKGTESLPLTEEILVQGNPGEVERVREGSQKQPSDKNEERVSDWKVKMMPNREGAATQPFKLRCGVCDVKLCSEIDMISHLDGKRHAANMEILRDIKKPGCSRSVIKVQEAHEQNSAATLKQEDKGIVESIEHTASSEPKPVQHTESDNVALVKKKTDALLDAKEMTLPLTKAQHKWNCSLCLVTTTSEQTLNAHIQGKKHKSKLVALKTSQHDEKGTESLPSSKDILRAAVKELVGEGSQQKPSMENEESVLF